jgi:murein DD-endopeptidase MepM/ murein hydrolase activator NlpD
VARHRSPKGRRAHLEPPLSALAAAGVGGAHRSVPISQLSSSLPVRFIATAVAGGALAAVGQHALVANLPAAADDANVLRLGVQELLGSGVDPAAADPTAIAASTAVATSARTEPLVTLAPVVSAPERPAEPDVADARDLVKAAEMQRQAVESDVADANAKAEAATRAALEKAVRPDAAKDATDESYTADAKGDTAKGDPARGDPAKGDTAKGDAAGKASSPKNQTGAAAGAAAAAAEAAAEATPDKPKADTSSLGGAGIQMITGRVTSGFGARWGVRHDGLDIAAPIGTPIRVPIGGTVIDSGPASGFGLWVRVRHADGAITTYGHINRSLVTNGEQVKAGQEIAEVGNRGQSTGPHLHIEVMTPGGTKINPRPWLDQHGIGY